MRAQRPAREWKFDQRVFIQRPYLEVSGGVVEIGRQCDRCRCNEHLRMLRSIVSMALLSFGPFSVIVSIHSEARHQVAVFKESILTTQRVLKLPCRTMRLYASSQLKGIFSTLPSRGSRSLLLSAGSTDGGGTALHLSWNEIRVNPSSLCI